MSRKSEPESARTNASTTDTTGATWSNVTVGSATCTLTWAVAQSAQSAVRDVALRVDVNSLNRPAGNDQRDAQQREEKPPRALHLRS